MKKFKAFSLLEVMIVLAISGIMMISISQGSRLLQQAKIYKTVAQISNIRSISLSSVSIDASDEEIWQELISKNILSKNDKKAAVGGIFLFEDQKLFLAGNKNKSGILSSSQAKNIKEQIDGTTSNEEGIVKILSDSRVAAESSNNSSIYFLEIEM